MSLSISEEEWIRSCVCQQDSRNQGSTAAYQKQTGERQGFPVCFSEGCEVRKEVLCDE